MHAVLAAALLVVGQADSSVAQANYRPQVGQTHSDFALPDIETGQLRTLSSYRGKKVLLVHFASW